MALSPSITRSQLPAPRVRQSIHHRDAHGWSAVYAAGPIPAGETTYNVFLITHSVQKLLLEGDDLFRLEVQ